MNNKFVQIAKNILYVLVFLIFFIPIYWAIVTSFKQSTEMFVFPPRWVTLSPTLEHYIKVLLNTQVPLNFRNSLFISLVTVLVTLVLSTIATYGFSRFKFKFKNIILISLIVIRMLPPSILIVPLYVMINRLGLLDTYWGLIFVYTSMNIPFSIWILKIFFDSVPRELDESAALDGCGQWLIFYKIILPLTRPGLIAVSILTFFLSWNEFIIALILTSSAKVRTISLGLYAFMSEQGVQWGSMTAAATLAILPPAIFFIIFQKYFISGITGGAVKE
jgi:multiple sugar transport system permease protein